jgi:magnesium-transporting ATPase (P-type)
MNALESMRSAIDEMAGQGLRVLAVAEAQCDEAALPVSQEGFRFRYLGLLGLADPLRREIPDAVRQCKEAGIRVVMITGDYPGTAESIARQAGLDAGTVLSGDELDRLNDAQLASCLQTSNVCARIAPEQKLRIVQALKANGEIVAMTGDGVNDAPALKAAHVGVAWEGGERMWRARQRRSFCWTTISLLSCAASGSGGVFSRTCRTQCPTFCRCMCQSPAWPCCLRCSVGRFCYIRCKLPFSN